MRRFRSGDTIKCSGKFEAFKYSAILEDAGYKTEVRHKYDGDEKYYVEILKDRSNE